MISRLDDPHHLGRKSLTREEVRKSADIKLSFGVIRSIVSFQKIDLKRANRKTQKTPLEILPAVLLLKRLLQKITKLKRSYEKECAKVGFPVRSILLLSTAFAAESRRYAKGFAPANL